MDLEKDLRSLSIHRNVSGTDESGTDQQCSLEFRPFDCSFSEYMACDFGLI